MAQSRKQPAKKKAAPRSNVPSRREQAKGDVALNDYGDFIEDAGGGFENVDASDLLIPRLVIVQDISPQVKKDSKGNPVDPQKFIEGAKPGDICDVGVGDLFEPPVIFLPVYYRKQWLRWGPRSSNRGLVQVYDDDTIMDETEKNDKKQNVMPDGDIIQETAQFYGFNMSAGGRRCFIPMAVSQLKHARRWLTQMRELKILVDGKLYNPPMYFQTYELGVADESNAEGNWVGWHIEKGQRINGEVAERDFKEKGTAYKSGDVVSEPLEGWRELRDEARLFRDSLIKGEARGDLASMREETTGGGRGSESAGEEAEM